MTLEEKASQVVHEAAPIPRLHIPAYNWWAEGLHGVARAGTATAFPEPIGPGATFDTPLIKQMATVIGTEARAKHRDPSGKFHPCRIGRVGPTINIVRDPRWGRGQETYGEDPFLTSRLAVAAIAKKVHRIFMARDALSVAASLLPTASKVTVRAHRSACPDMRNPCVVSFVPYFFWPEAWEIMQTTGLLARLDLTEERPFVSLQPQNG